MRSQLFFEWNGINSLVILFFSITFITGVLLFNDYGISWDEPIQKELGNTTLDYIMRDNDSLFNLINKYHGPFIEMLEQLPEKILNIKDQKEIYLWRHAINYFIFWLGGIFFFLLAFKVFRNKRYALLAVVMLFLTPRIFAHAFYNSKDIPLLVFFIITIYLLFVFSNKPSIITAILLALVSGITFDIRILGILLPLFVLIMFMLRIFTNQLKLSSLKFLLVYLLLFPLAIYCFYPVIWSSPIQQLRQSFLIMSHYPFDDPQLFMGILIKPQQLPWYYIPVWMGITIPVSWILFFIIGTASIVIVFVKNPSSFLRTESHWIIIIAWLVIPYLIILILNSAVYDEWRHLFFIYPPLILIATVGIRYLWNHVITISTKLTSTAIRFLIAALFVAQVINTISFQIKYHPFEFAYFNFLAGKNVEQKYDLDYWGLSYRQGIEQLCLQNSDDSIKVCWQNDPGKFNLIWLLEKDKRRIINVSWDSADYFITNYRFHPELFNNLSLEKKYSITVDGNSILGVYKR